MMAILFVDIILFNGCNPEKACIEATQKEKDAIINGTATTKIWKAFNHCKDEWVRDTIPEGPGDPGNPTKRTKTIQFHLDNKPEFDEIMTWVIDTLAKEDIARVNFENHGDGSKHNKDEVRQWMADLVALWAKSSKLTGNRSVINFPSVHVTQSEETQLKKMGFDPKLYSPPIQYRTATVYFDLGQEWDQFFAFAQAALDSAAKDPVSEVLFKPQGNGKARTSEEVQWLTRNLASLLRAESKINGGGNSELKFMQGVTISDSSYIANRGYSFSLEPIDPDLCPEEQAAVAAAQAALMAKMVEFGAAARLCFAATATFISEYPEYGSSITTALAGVNTVKDSVYKCWAQSYNFIVFGFGSMGAAPQSLQDMYRTADAAKNIYDIEIFELFNNLQYCEWLLTQCRGSKDAPLKKANPNMNDHNINKKLETTYRNAMAMRTASTRNVVSGIRKK